MHFKSTIQFKKTKCSRSHVFTSTIIYQNMFGYFMFTVLFARYDTCSSASRSSNKRTLDDAGATTCWWNTCLSNDAYLVYRTTWMTNKHISLCQQSVQDWLLSFAMPLSQKRETWSEPNKSAVMVQFSLKRIVKTCKLWEQNEHSWNRTRPTVNLLDVDI